MANKAANVQQSIAAYYTALQRGVPRQQAFAQAFPQGLPTQQELQEQRASDGQKAAIGQIGGMLLGVLGSKAVYNGISYGNVFGKGGTPEWIKNAFSGLEATGAGASQAAGSVTPGQVMGVPSAQLPSSLGGGETMALPSSDGGASTAATNTAGAVQGGGMPYWSFGTPSWAGIGAGAIQAGIGAANYFGSDAYEKDKNKQATIDAGLAATDVFTGGLASGANFLAKKALGDENYNKIIDTFAPISPLYRILNAVGSKKSEQQYMRDQWRKEAQDRGWVSGDERMLGTLADGSQFAFGKNENFNTGKFDEKDEVSRNVAGLGDVIASAQGLTGKARESVATLLTNAARSNANGDLGVAQANMRHFAEQYGLTPENIKQNLDVLHQEGKIDDSQHGAWTGQIGLLFSPTGQAYAPYKQGQALAGALK